MGSLALTFPNQWKAGSTIGAILQNFQVFIAFRFASGTAYTGCASADGNEDVRSGDVCNHGGFPGGLNTLRLPLFKQFDMRFVKGFTLGHNQLSLYLDARNILNFTNVLTQYVVTHSITSEVQRQNNFHADSSLYAAEGQRRTAYTSRMGASNSPSAGAGRRDAPTGSIRATSHRCRTASICHGRSSGGETAMASSPWRSSCRRRTRCTTPTWRRRPFFYGAGTQLRLGVEFTF